MPKITVEKPTQMKRATESGTFAKELATSISSTPMFGSVSVDLMPSVTGREVKVEITGKKKAVEQVIRDAVDATVKMRSAIWRI
jgi:hypothetical protein